MGSAESWRICNSGSVPVCDHWDHNEKRPRPPVRYLIQGIRHPSTAGIQTIRTRIREISITAEARRSDAFPLVLLPHDRRRLFASEHLNNNTPVHVIQALLGHGSSHTVMIHARLYPSQLIVLSCDLFSGFGFSTNHGSEGQNL